MIQAPPILHSWKFMCPVCPLDPLAYPIRSEGVHALDVGCCRKPDKDPILLARPTPSSPDSAPIDFGKGFSHPPHHGSRDTNPKPSQRHHQWVTGNAIPGNSRFW